MAWAASRICFFVLSFFPAVADDVDGNDGAVVVVVVVAVVRGLLVLADAASNNSSSLVNFASKEAISSAVLSNDVSTKC